MELEPDLVVAKAVTGQARPVDRVLAFLDPLLGCTPAIVEPSTGPALSAALSKNSSATPK